MLRAFLIAGAILGSFILAVAKDDPLPQAPPPRTIPFAELVRQLSGDNFLAREAATKRLCAMAFEPPQELLDATKSDDPDLRERARKAVVAMRLNAAALRLPRGEEFARRGAVDLFVAATATWDLKADDPRLWNPALDLGRALLVKAKMTGNRKPINCPASLPTFGAYRQFCNPRFTRVDECYRRKDQPNAGQPPGYYPEAIQAPGVAEGAGLVYNVVVSRGDVKVETAIQASVIFANGNITTGMGISRSVVACDGDVHVDEQFRGSVVIARGNIMSKHGASASYLVAGGKITLHNQQQRNTADNQFVLTEESVATPFGWITFFELTRVGLEVKATGGAVTVASVATGSAGEKAGLRVSDTVVRVGGQAPTDAESLRRLLRDALSVGDAVLTVRRGDTTHTVKIRLPE